jgi:hypothetical protein
MTWRAGLLSVAACLVMLGLQAAYLRWDMHRALAEQAERHRQIIDAKLAEHRAIRDAWITAHPPGDR